MNTRQISRILKRCPKTSPTFVGCVPADGIPIRDDYPYSVVVNTDNFRKPGRHWVAIYAVSEDVVEYFDSFGQHPNRQIGSFLRRFPVRRRSVKGLQSRFSQACGPYCIYFVTKRSSGQSFAKVVDELSRCRNPDLLVVRFSKRLASTI